MKMNLEHGKEYYLRSMIVAPKDHVLISCDLSQAEAWVVAYLSNDPLYKYNLLNSDVHTATGSFIFNTEFSLVTKPQRYIGKKCNHSLSYGMSHYGLVEAINAESDLPPYVVVTNSECKVYYDKWHSLYVNIQAWWKETEDLLRSNRTLTTPYGRSRHFHGRWGKELFKEAYAFVPQSTVADHFRGLIHPDLDIPGGVQLVRKKLASYKDVKIINQAHDSVMIECPTNIGMEIAQLTASCLKRPIPIKHELCTIPVDCEMGERWGELEKVKLSEAA